MRETGILERGFEPARCQFAHIEKPAKRLPDANCPPRDPHKHGPLLHLQSRLIRRARPEPLG